MGKSQDSEPHDSGLIKRTVTRSTGNVTEIPMASRPSTSTGDLGAVLIDVSGTCSASKRIAFCYSISEVVGD